MKAFRLTYKFYITFFLVSFIPSFWIAKGVTGILDNVTLLAPTDAMLRMGLIEPPTTVVVMFALFVLTDRLLWKHSPLSNLFRIPNINGRYEGLLVSSYDESQSYKIVVEIQQTLTNVFVTLYTENSSSYSLAADVGVNEHKNWSVFYIYQNRTATVNHNQDMKDHNGTCVLDIFKGGNTLKGNYYNNPRDRGRHGSIEIKRVSGSLKGCFENS